MTSDHALKQHRNQPYEIDRQQVGGTQQSWFLVRCGQCPATERIHMHVNLTPDAVKHKFRNRDWHIDHRRAGDHLCPKCRKAPTPKPMEPKEMAQNITPAASVREPTMVETLRTFALVEGNWDDKKSCYLPTISDDWVAKQLDLPRALVTKIREAAGFKIKGNPEVLALKDECATLRVMLNEIEGRIAKLENQPA